MKSEKYVVQEINFLQQENSEIKEQLVLLKKSYEKQLEESENVQRKLDIAKIHIELI